MSKGRVFLFLGVIVALCCWWTFDRESMSDAMRSIGRFTSDFDWGSKLISVDAPTRRPGETIQIATFNLHEFGKSKARKQNVMILLARVIRQFDVIAVQEITADDQNVVPVLAEYVNSTGRRYEFLVGPRQGRGTAKEQFAFLYDTDTIFMDLKQWYSVHDPHDMLTRDPLVGWFRAKGVAPEQAFTFSIVNVRVHEDDRKRELAVMGQVYRKVRDDGRHEDDVIVLGDFSTDGSRLGPIAAIRGMTCAVTAAATNTRRTAQYDNIVFHRHNTDEYTGRAGVFDFLRHFNLTQAQADEISDHLPVWAEFSVYEGGPRHLLAEVP